MDYHDHPFWTERFDNDADLRESNALTFTADDVAEWDEDDHEAACLAMERDMDERDRCWRDEAMSLRTEVAELRGEEV